MSRHVLRHLMVVQVHQIVCLVRWVTLELWQVACLCVFVCGSASMCGLWLRLECNVPLTGAVVCHYICQTRQAYSLMCTRLRNSYVVVASNTQKSNICNCNHYCITMHKATPVAASQTPRQTDRLFLNWLLCWANRQPETRAQTHTPIHVYWDRHADSNTH